MSEHDCWCCGACEFAWQGGNGFCPNCGIGSEHHARVSFDELDGWIDQQTIDYPGMDWRFDHDGQPMGAA